jgi:hypothetical protein
VDRLGLRLGIGVEDDGDGRADKAGGRGHGGGRRGVADGGGVFDLGGEIKMDGSRGLDFGGWSGRDTRCVRRIGTRFMGAGSFVGVAGKEGLRK